MKVIDFLSLASKTAEMSVVRPDLIIFYVRSAEITLAEGTEASITIELSHKSLTARSVPFANTLLNPFTSTLARKASVRYFN